LAELEQAGELIPNQGILINALPLLEAQASSEIDPLVHMAVMHYQFEAGLLTLPILHLSRYIIRNREDYYRLLIGVRVATRLGNLGFSMSCVVSRKQPPGLKARERASANYPVTRRSFSEAYGQSSTAANCSIFSLNNPSAESKT
jgi:hypothetical protein